MVVENAAQMQVSFGCLLAKGGVYVSKGVSPYQHPSIFV